MTSKIEENINIEREQMSNSRMASCISEEHTGSLVHAPARSVLSSRDSSKAFIRYVDHCQSEERVYRDYANGRCSNQEIVSVRSDHNGQGKDNQRYEVQNLAHQLCGNHKNPDRVKQVVDNNTEAII